MQKDYEVVNRSQTYIVKDDNVSLFNKTPRETAIDEKPVEKTGQTTRAIKTKRSRTIRTKSSKKVVGD